MSPEQAEGRLDLLGPASDVYSLGATLYVVLTGRAPFAGNDAGEVLPRVQRGEFSSPRAVDPSIPKPLEAICLKAMELKPADRYATPRLLAEDIEHWLADEPVSAYREPWPDRLRRWSRQHRTLVTSAAAVLVLGLLGSVGFAAVVTGKNRDLAKQTQRAESREQMAIEAVKRFRDVVVEEPVLKNNPVARKAAQETAQGAAGVLQVVTRAVAGRPRDKAGGAWCGWPKRRTTTRTSPRKSETSRTAFGRTSRAWRSGKSWCAIIRRKPIITRSGDDLRTAEARCCRRTGHPDQALESYGKARAIYRAAGATNPSVTEFQSDLAQSHHNIGLLQAPRAIRTRRWSRTARRWRSSSGWRENPSVTEFQSRPGPKPQQHRSPPERHGPSGPGAGVVRQGAGDPGAAGARASSGPRLRERSGGDAEQHGDDRLGRESLRAISRQAAAGQLLAKEGPGRLPEAPDVSAVSPESPNELDQGRQGPRQ